MRKAISVWLRQPSFSTFLVPHATLWHLFRVTQTCRNNCMHSGHNSYFSGLDSIDSGVLLFSYIQAGIAVSQLFELTESDLSTCCILYIPYSVPKVTYAVGGIYISICLNCWAPLRSLLPSVSYHPCQSPEFFFFNCMHYVFACIGWN